MSATTTTDVRHDQPDLSLVYAIHHALREDAIRLHQAITRSSADDRAERIRGIRLYFQAYTGQLVAHHTHEDEVFFPALAAHVGADAFRADELERQHHDLDGVLTRCADAIDALADQSQDAAAARHTAASATSDLVAGLVEHLALEEQVCFPLYLANVGTAEHAALEETVRNMGTFEQLTFMVPWLFDRLPGDVRTTVLAGLPEFLQMVYIGHVAEYRALAAPISGPRP